MAAIEYYPEGCHFEYGKFPYLIAPKSDHITEDLKTAFTGSLCKVTTRKFDPYGRAIAIITIGDIDICQYIKAKYPETITASGFGINSQSIDK